MLCPWAYQTKNHTKILQELIASEKSIAVQDISLNEIIEYLNTVDGPTFGVKTFAPVYEHGKSIKEIDLVWAPNIESMLTEQFIDFSLIFIASFIYFTDESFDGALLTRPIESYLNDSSDIDVLFGYTSAVNEFLT